MANAFADWRQLIAAADAVAPPSRIVDTAHGAAGGGGSEPQNMSGPEGVHCAVKFVNNRQGVRVLFNDQVSARVGRLIGAPCPSVQIVDVDAAVAATVTYNNPRFGLTAVGGPSHGSDWLENIRASVNLADALQYPENRPRYTRLMVLFTIAANQDHQYVLGTIAPYHLYCVDFGWAFGATPDWTEASIGALPLPSAILDPVAALDSPTLLEISARLASITNAEIAAAVAGIPATWAVSLEERVAATIFLRSRIDSVRGLI